MKRSVITSARLHCQAIPSGFRAAMITLTYGPFSDWEARHASEFLKRARHWMARRGHVLRYAWVMELTKAGEPHYHVVLWLPRRVKLPKPDKAGWWPHGCTRIEWARHAVGYLAKYASKGNPWDRFPKGARIHGAGGLTADARNERSWWLAPSYVRDRCEPADLPRRAPGGGWVLKATGEWFRSPWRYLGFFPGIGIVVQHEDTP